MSGLRSSRSSFRRTDRCVRTSVCSNSRTACARRPSGSFSSRAMATSAATSSSPYLADSAGSASVIAMRSITMSRIEIPCGLYGCVGVWVSHPYTHTPTHLLPHPHQLQYPRKIVEVIELEANRPASLPVVDGRFRAEVLAESLLECCDMHGRRAIRLPPGGRRDGLAGQGAHP